MGDFPPSWTLVRDLPEGGQAHTFVVRRADGSEPEEYVLKRLKYPNRKDYFEREIRVCMTLGHPNVLKVLEHGQTPKGKPLLITEYCSGGSIERALASTALPQDFAFSNRSFPELLTRRPVINPSITST